MYTQVIGIFWALLLGLTSAYPHGNQASIRSVRTEARRGAQQRNLGMFDGQSTTIQDHPYVVGILVDGKLVCTGAILTEQWVIALAGCFYEATRKSIAVVVGSDDGISGTSYSAQKLVTHPNYTVTSYDYDFALVKVKGTFSWGDTVGNLSLPTQDVTKGTKLTVVSYGGNYDVAEPNSSGTLTQGTMKWIRRDMCTADYEDLDITITPRMGCAYNSGKTTLCGDDDWGAPFVLSGVLYALFDVVSGDNFCTTYARPVIVADVYSVVDWIQSYTTQAA